jgi:hypothetical protein
LTGFALATGVSLFIIPVTSRKVVMKEVAGYIGLLRGALGAHKTYIHSLENSDMFGKTYVPEAKPKDKDEKVKPKLKPEIESIKKMIGGIQELHGKLTADLPFAKREIAYGKLTPDDLETLFKQLRAIMMPVLGLSSVMDLFERAAELNHWSDDDDEPEHDEQRKKAVSEWNDMFQYLHDPFSEIFKALDDGLAHVLLKLGLSQRRGRRARRKTMKKPRETASDQGTQALQSIWRNKHAYSSAKRSPHYAIGSRARAST